MVAFWARVVGPIDFSFTGHTCAPRVAAQSLSSRRSLAPQFVQNFSAMLCMNGSGYFAGLRMTVAKCIILNNYVAV